MSARDYTARLRNMLRWAAATLQAATNAKNPLFENDVITLDDDAATVGEILNDADSILGEAPPAPPGPPARTRALPRPRKIWGTAHDIDGRVMIYTEDQMAEFGDLCFADGLRAHQRHIEHALRDGGVMLDSRPLPTEADRIQAEEQAWGDFNAGRGRRPRRR